MTYTTGGTDVAQNLQLSPQLPESGQINISVALIMVESVENLTAMRGLSWAGLSEYVVALVSTVFLELAALEDSIKSPTNKNTTSSGAVGSAASGRLKVGAGPIACVKVAAANATDKLSTDIRLYFLDGNSRIAEARLPNAHYSSTDPATTWVVPAPDKEGSDKLSILAKDGLDPQIRLVDPTSYLTAGRTKTAELPYVVWQVKGKPAVVRYAYATKDGSGDLEWKSETLKAQLMPKDS